MTTKNKNTETLTPRLAALRAGYVAGGRLSIEDILNACAQDLRDEWQIDRQANEAAAVAAERRTWTPDLAEFIATALAADDSGLFPRDTAFTTDVGQIVPGNPTVLIEPASKVEHDGSGRTAGKVTLTFHHVDSPNSKWLVAVLQRHALAKVDYGNWPTTTVSSTGWVFALPHISNPTAAGLAGEIQRELRGMNNLLNSDGSTTVVAAFADATIGKSEIVRQDDESVVVRGHVLATSGGTDTMGNSIRFTHNEMTAAAERVVDRYSKTGGFVSGVGVVESAEIVNTEPVEVKGSVPGLGIAFEVTARGKYATAA